MKRGVSDQERKLHEYLVSRSVRNTPELDELQQVRRLDSSSGILPHGRDTEVVMSNTLLALPELKLT